MTEKEKELQKENERLKKELDYTKEQLDQLKKLIFGRSKETFHYENPDQLSLFEESTLVKEPETEDITTVSTYRRKKKKGKKADQLANLPATDHHYELVGDDCCCPECAHALKEIGQKVVREEPVFVPATLRKDRHIQHSYTCPNCEAKGETRIIQAEVPRAVLPHSLTSPSVLSEVITLKYDLALPLYRQEREWKHHGLELTRKTMSHWILRVCDLYLHDLVELMKEKLIQQPAVHADETHYRMTQSSQQKNYMWLFRSVESSTEPIVFYEYDDSRSQTVLKRVLSEDYAGYLHCDGYAAYGTLGKATLVGCLAHVRRKFFEALPSNPKECPTHPAVMGVQKCDRLFEVDRTIRKQKTDLDEIAQERQKLLKPLLNHFEEWLETVNAAVKSKLGTAVSYARKRWTSVKNVLEDGSLALSNNLAERSIKPIVIGRKNYLFSTSREGARSNAIIYSIIETAKANSLDVRKYFQYLFTKLPQIDCLDAETLEKFLPWKEEIQLKCR